MLLPSPCFPVEVGSAMQPASPFHCLGSPQRIGHLYIGAGPEICMHMWTAKAQDVLSSRPVAGRGVKGVGHQTCLHSSVPQFRALENSPCVSGHDGKLNLRRLGVRKQMKCHGLEFSLILSLIGVMIGT